MGAGSFFVRKPDLTLVRKHHCGFGWLAHCNFGEVVKMMTLQIILYLLPLVNLVTIAVLVYFRKQNWVLALSLLEIIIVYLSLTN